MLTWKRSATGNSICEFRKIQDGKKRDFNDWGSKHEDSENLNKYLYMKIIDFTAFRDKQSFSLFLDFLLGEIPNIIQILGFPTLFAVLIKTSDIATNVIAIFTAVLLSLYMAHKLFQQIIEQIKDPLSTINRNKIDTKTLAPKMFCYLVCISIANSLLVIGLVRLSK